MSDITQIKSAWGLLAYLFKFHFTKIIIVLAVIAVCIISITIGFSVNNSYISIEKDPIKIEQIKK